MMDPAMLMAMNGMNPMAAMGAGVNPMALQEIIGNNMAMMQQMAGMMMDMHQQHQQLAQNQQSPPPTATPNRQNGSSKSLSAAATPFTPSTPTIYVPVPPPSMSICKHGVGCTNARCPNSHPSPVATSESGVVLSTEVCDKGPGGVECKDVDCVKSHLSPAAAKPGKRIVILEEGKVDINGLSNDIGIKVQFVDSKTGKQFGADGKPLVTDESKPSNVSSSLTPVSKPPVTSVTSAVPCKFGIHCTRPNCHYSHPNRRSHSTNLTFSSHPTSNSNSTPCKFGTKCTRADCSFSHPPGRITPNHNTFHKGLGTNTKASEASVVVGGGAGSREEWRGK